MQQFIKSFLFILCNTAIKQINIVYFTKRV